MIKLGCMSLSYRDRMAAGEMSVEEFIETAYRLRLDGVDLHTSAFPDTEPATLRRLRHACHRRGLAICYLAVSNDFGKQGEALQEEVAKVKRWISIAQEMGVPMVRIFAAWIPQGETKERVWSRMLDAIGQVVAEGERRDVVLGLHNHNHGCVTATGEDVVRILQEVNSSYLTHILDTGQYVGSPGASGADRSRPAEERLYASIAASAPYAVHVRAKFYRISSGVEEWLDYPRILDILAAQSFNGWMSIVYEGWDVEPSPTAVPKAVAYLRKLLRERNL
ncbi:MAG: hypothetical protein KatS3mg115_2069 [Candidatus Poribacteria bacterium]|nr:MAG: hypothetical protein KatS3mg115_2069 [Candidatus Poribacteria bacterium]